uniref:Ankyrin repeat-containing protein At3g12360 n=2 Tax=Anthurium amnicola TaxID=1678845 RepID=A0A1D1XE57_9ARAE
MLLERKPELSRIQDSYQSTPLHYAASDGDSRMVQLLLWYDASVAYISDADGISPIHVAAAMGHVGVIEELIRSCPDSGELTDNKGRNLLHFAVDKKRVDIVKYILRTPLLKEMINMQDHDGNTALHLATSNRSREIVHMLLADKRVNANIMNHKSFTPLDIACSCAKSYMGLRMLKIRQALVSAGSQLSPQRLDHLANKKQRNREEEAIRCRAIANNLAIVAVLVATVTFAAAFTLPGGYRNDPGPDQGTAFLTKKAAFKAFLLSDAIAMVCSIIVICLLIRTGSLDHDVRLSSISSSMKLMQVALAGMVAAFAAGVYVVTADECLWLAILICLVACSVPLWVITSRPTFKPLKAGKAYIEGKALSLTTRSKNCRKKVYSNGGSESEERIYVPMLLKIMGFERTIDFQTPPLSKEPSN